MESRAGVKEESLPTVGKPRRYVKISSVKLTTSDERKLSQLVKDRRYFSRSEVLREGLRRIFQEEYGYAKIQE